MIQGTASEGTLVALLSARSKALSKLKIEYLTDDNENQELGCVVTKLVGYASRESHSSVERAGMLAGVKFRLLDTDEDLSVRGETLRKAIKKDR